MNKVIKMGLHTKDRLKGFYTVLRQIDNKVNLCESQNVDISELNIYSWMDLREPLFIEIVADSNGNISKAYELLKEFEVE